MDEPQTQTVPDRLVTPQELMAWLQISPRTYHRLMRAKLLPVRWVMGQARFRLAEVWTGLPAQRQVVRGSAAPSVAAGPGVTNLTEYLKRKAKSCRTK